MADEEKTAAPVTETDQQPSDSAFPSEHEIDGMLATIPGLDKYFGSEQSEEKKKPESPPSEENVPRGTLPPAVEEPAQEESVPAEEEKVPAPEEEKDLLPPSVQKRIDKLTAQKHEAIEKVEVLESKVKELEGKIGTVSTPPTPENPLANVHTVEELTSRLEKARKIKTWALENLDGGEVQTEKGETQFLDGAAVKRWLALSESLISEHIPQRKQYLETRAAFDVEAKKFYPNLYKSGTEENLTLLSWIRTFPEVLRFPDFQLIIADALAGQKIRFAKAKASGGNGQEKEKKPTLAAPSPSSGSKIPQKSALSKELLNRMATDRSALDVFSESLINKS
jgi:hypothetical protein